MELVFQVLRWRALPWSREPWRWRSTLACPPPCSAMPASSWPRTSTSSWKRWQPPLENHDNLLQMIMTTSSQGSWQPPPKDPPHHKSIPCCSSGSLATTQLLFQPSPTPLLPRTGIFIRGAINSQREENCLLHSGDPESFCIQYRQKRYLTVFHSQREKQCQTMSKRSVQKRWRTISPPRLPSSSPVSHKVYPTTLQTWTGKTETKQSSLKHFSLENSWVPLSGLICLKENLLLTSSRSEWIYPSEWCFVWKGACGIDQERRHIWHNETWWAWSHDR